VPWQSGTFRHWTIHAEAQPALEDYLRGWTRKHMRGYFGMMNFETIGGRIIESHLRFADQWCDLYGDGWVEALVALYATGRWSFDEGERKTGYSIPLFAQHSIQFRHPPPHLQAEVRAMPKVKSLQITFFEERDPSLHPMPPGGFRLGVVNATGLAEGHAARRRLATSFPGEAILSQDEAR
jgi:hypothetical protein